MTIRENIASLTENSKILDFADFVLAGLNDGDLPDYSSLDIVSDSKFMPQLVVIDYRDGIEKGVLVDFSGPKINDNFGRSLQGQYLEDVYTGVEIKYKLLEFFHSLFTTKRAFFISSCVHYEQPDNSWVYKHSDGLFFPCSSDKSNVDYGVGLVDYRQTDERNDQVFEFLTP